MGTVSKGDITRNVAEMTGQTVAAAKATIDAFLVELADHAERGDTIRLMGFGSFSVKARPARPGRNPKTGDTIAIPESRKLVFKASKAG